MYQGNGVRKGWRDRKSDQNPNTITPICRLQDANFFSCVTYSERMDARTHAQKCASVLPREWFYRMWKATEVGDREKEREREELKSSVFHINLSLSLSLSLSCIWFLYWPPQFSRLAWRTGSFEVQNLVSFAHRCIQTSETITTIPMGLYVVWKRRSKQVAKGRTKPLSLFWRKQKYKWDWDWMIREKFTFDVGASGFNVTKDRTLQLQYSCRLSRNIHAKALRNSHCLTNVTHVSDFFHCKNFNNVFFRNSCSSYSEKIDDSESNSVSIIRVL